MDSITMTRVRRRRLAGPTALLAALGLLATSAVAAPVVVAETVITVNTTSQEINGDGFCSLQEAIYAANLDDNVAPDPADPSQLLDTACPGGSGHDIIELPSMGVFLFTSPIDDADNYIGPTVTPIITSAITIEGADPACSERPASSRGRSRSAPTGFLDLREVHVKGFSIHGGDGNDGGGGGMGAGGAIYVQLGQLLVQWSTFEANRAEGGDGAYQGRISGGGGGGLSGDGGDGNSANEFEGGGGGGGSRGNGSASDAVFIDNEHTYGGGGGGRVTSAAGPTPGEPCGGAGGKSLQFPPDGANDGSDGACRGGGGGGGTDREFIADPFCGGDGGDGDYGGGGGGGGANGDGGHGGFGGGGGGNGGDGDFGGGGGSEEGCALSESAGQGGTFAGDGTVQTSEHGPAGGGGAGLGGAIFGYLADIEVSNSTFSGNVAQWGRAGGEGANDGRGAGGAIFTVAGDLRVESSTFSGNDAVTVTDGGGGAIVVYDPIGSDEATLLLRNTIIAGNGEAECYTRNGVDTGGSDGNIVTDSSAPHEDNDDEYVPCPGVDGSDDPGLGALALNAPGRTPTMAISAGSNAIDVAVGTNPLDDQRGIARPQGAAADIGAFELEVPTAVPPVSSITLSPADPDGSNGWYRSAVGVTVAATDADGDLSQTRCALDPAATPSAFAELPDASCDVASVGTDGDHALYAASDDTAGNEESPLVSAMFRIDRTGPVVQPSLSAPSPIGIGQSGVTALANATDATSGVASSGCGTVDTSTPGAKTVTCTATDNAGNETSVTLDYVVEYRILGFFEPVPGSKWKLGQTVPAKIALGDAAGTRISDAEASALAQACRVQFSASGAQTRTPICAKYDPEKDQFVATWKLGKRGTGPATIRMSVSYPGTTVETRLTLSITIIR